VLAGSTGVANNGVLVDADQAAGLSDTAALDEVVQDRDPFVGGQAAVEEGGALALGAAPPACAASEHAALFVGPVAEADPEIVATPTTEVGAGGVLAAEMAELVHEAPARSVTVRTGSRLDGTLGSA
jgi:hypothetical protein